MMLLKVLSVLIVAVAALHQTYATRPNYITDEEFQKVIGVPIIPSNTSVLPLPKFGEGVSMLINLIISNSF